MSLALAEAEAAAARAEVPVGAVVVSATGQVIARAGNEVEARQDPTAHAELLALQRAARQRGTKWLSDATLYVTLEPCALCAAAISQFRLLRLVYGAYDPKGGAVDHGPRWFSQPTCLHRPEVISGVREQEGALLLRRFFHDRRAESGGHARLHSLEAGGQTEYPEERGPPSPKTGQETPTVYDTTNIFARLLRGEIPCKRVHETAHALAFHDIAPQAPVHVLVIPKGAYVSSQDFAASASAEEIAGFWRTVAETAALLGVVEPGYRLVSNHGRDALQSVPHYHVHILAGAAMGARLVP
ncbi:MAG: HIT domain-containing protein [Alphaproteobacteria bacterium]|nr:MAG: HIT domain-containing protein [Alphaproteobacteria bacterium]